MVKASIRSAVFVAFLGTYLLYEYLTLNDGSKDTSSSTVGGHIPNRRSLFEDAINVTVNDAEQQGDAMEHDILCDDITTADPRWTVGLYLLGVLYTFLAIAIVCDELFVPTLEEIASSRHLNLNMDVAGATLMAAGGSAPELFTNVFGTFVQHSEVGIGTVVGSAVFNVLFVIAMCAIFARDTLELTWYPLFRDSTYYSIGLILLGLFVGVISPSVVELWEAIVLFVMYIGYVTMMAFNKNLYKLLTGKELERGETSTPEESGGGGGGGGGANTANNSVTNAGTEKTDEDNIDLHRHEHNTSIVHTYKDGGNCDGDRDGDVGDVEAPRQDTTLKQQRRMRQHLDRDQSVKSFKSVDARSLVSIQPTSSGDDSPPWPLTFRSGILKLLRSKPMDGNKKRNWWMDSAGIGVVAIIAGDVHHIFRQVDVDGNGEIDKEELAHLFAKLDCNLPTDEDGDDSLVNQVMEALDDNKDGRITEEDFTAWYINSEQQILKRVRTIFDYFDTNKSGTIDRDKIKNLLETVEPTVSDEDVDQAMVAMYQTGSKNEITFDEFSNWYIHSIIYQEQTKRVQEDMNGIFESLKLPTGSDGRGITLGCCLEYIKYIIVLPIVLVLAFTVPDVRRPGWHKFCYVSFFLSILWIGFFSYYMVDWAEIIGHTIGIPSVIMGLTLLAAGTSVPDLLTSVIVARMGEGDMALSSSIGSNIFDILVGLPLPWIAYTAYNDTVITVGTIWLEMILTTEVDEYAFVHVSNSFSHRPFSLLFLSYRLDQIMSGCTYSHYWECWSLSWWRHIVKDGN